MIYNILNRLFKDFRKWKEQFRIIYQFNKDYITVRLEAKNPLKMGSKIYIVRISSKNPSYSIESWIINEKPIRSQYPNQEYKIEVKGSNEINEIMHDLKQLILNGTKHNFYPNYPF